MWTSNPVGIQLKGQNNNNNNNNNKNKNYDSMYQTKITLPNFNHLHLVLKYGRWHRVTIPHI